MKLLKFLAFFLTAIFGISVIVSVVSGGLDVNKILGLFDSYARLVLSSWPAAILLLGSLLLVRHRDAVDHFIRNRMTGVGFDGVRGDVIAAEASDGEVKIKEVADAKVDEEIATAQTPIVIEDGIDKPSPHTLKKEVYERYKKRKEVEDRMQTILISKFPDTYRPHVKLTMGSGKSLILDGLLTTYDGSMMQAVEIKYIQKELFPSLKYTLGRLLEKLELFGVKKMTAIIIADDLTQEDALRINDMLKTPIKRFFFSWHDDELTEILPSDKKPGLLN